MIVKSSIKNAFDEKQLEIKDFVLLWFVGRGISLSTKIVLLICKQSFFRSLAYVCRYTLPGVVDWPNGA